LIYSKLINYPIKGRIASSHIGIGFEGEGAGNISCRFEDFDSGGIKYTRSYLIIGDFKTSFNIIIWWTIKSIYFISSFIYKCVRNIIYTKLIDYLSKITAISIPDSVPHMRIDRPFRIIIEVAPGKVEFKWNIRCIRVGNVFNNLTMDSTLNPC